MNEIPSHVLNELRSFAQQKGDRRLPDAELDELAKKCLSTETISYVSENIRSLETMMRAGRWIKLLYAVARISTPGGRPQESVGQQLAGPSKAAEFFGALLVKTERRDYVLGCRAEDFNRNVARFGRKRAVFIYWWDSSRSLGPSLLSFIKRTALLGMFAELYRRAMGL
jgi:hypothetical protein